MIDCDTDSEYINLQRNDKFRISIWKVRLAIFVMGEDDGSQTSSHNPNDKE